MMKMKTTQKFLAYSILVAVLLLAACAPAASATTSGSARAWVDQPVTNALLPLAPFTIRGHASRPGGGIVKMAFLVNSIEVGNAGTDATAAIVASETEWVPSSPGEYSIQVQAFSADGVSVSEASQVCVSALATEPLAGFLGDCNSPLQVNLLSPGTPTPTATALPNCSPQGKVNKDINLRSGPSTSFPVLTSLVAGTSVLLVGVSADRTWLVIQVKNSDTRYWVTAGAITPASDLICLPVVVSPPTPTPTDVPPTDTPAPSFSCSATYGSSSAACSADSRCTFDAGLKACVNK
jgi:hypothetical protein